MFPLAFLSPLYHRYIVLLPCCFLRHMTVKSVAKADMMTSGTVMAMARIGPAQGEWTGGNKHSVRLKNQIIQSPLKQNCATMQVWLNYGTIKDDAKT